MSNYLYVMNFPFTFTNMDATGYRGPQNITYGDAIPGYLTLYELILQNGGIQQWIVPASFYYNITIAGAGNSLNYIGDLDSVNYYSWFSKRGFNFLPTKKIAIRHETLKIMEY